MALDEYKRKRNFRATREPAGGGSKGGSIFVVQLHHASHRHFDFRLELDGVLKSWAVPRGPSFDPAIKRLAVEVEDHPLAYATFEGDIPKGQYGGGHVDVFDHGTWEAIGDASQGLEKGELKFVLHGDVLKGSWVLVRTRKQASKQQWLLIKHADAFSGEFDVNTFVDPATDRPLPSSARKKAATGKSGPPRRSAGTAPTPRARRTLDVAETIEQDAFAPELCVTRISAPDGEDWLHEVKWDGYRMLATVVGTAVKFWSRNGIEWTSKLPVLVKAIKALKCTSAQFDGELIVLRDGRADFNALQAALSADDQSSLVYMLFDVPHLDLHTLRSLPLVERKQRLAKLLSKAEGVLRYSEHQVGHGRDVFDQAAAAGLEGIVSKRAASPYRGDRNGDWVKVKSRMSDEFVVIGYTEPKGKRAGIGALLLAARDDDGWHYVGRVGTGFTDKQLLSLRKRLARSVLKKSPAATNRMAPRDKMLAIWVKPTMVVEAFYQGIGGHGLLRHAAFKVVRTDKTAEDLMTDKNPFREKADRKVPARKHATSKTVPALTHAERVVYASGRIIKGDVAAYYRVVSPWILPEIAGRPLSVLRCPGGTAKACFFQKHLATGWGEHVHGVAVKTKTKREQYLAIDDEAGLLELVQMNVLELHPWGARSADQAHADRVVFDLDPHPDVQWRRVIAAARALRERLESIGLRTFVRTSGGKGLHVVVPLNPPAPWDHAKRFAQGVARAMSELHPEEFVSVAGVARRVDRIFIDWQRNARGATSIASYSLRARPEAGVAMPIAWSELGRVKSGNAFTIKNAIGKIKRRKVDPWQGIDEVEQSLDTLIE